ncbi:hypothetical protein [Flavobacterium sp. '19STA2R22 D10 B1']|uniref:hypothetical protein n=1 Tax=Flavobacterium aerium TaxID=3037261 RepID=UPI00278C7975|nr:hypothetical protein [Flavobacterium sp. '19STA2R22 D10 B1']
MKYFYLFLFPILTYGQVNFSGMPQTVLPSYGNTIQINTGYDANNENLKQQRQHEMIRKEVDQNEKNRIENLKELYRDINELKSDINYNLPDLSHLKGTSYYHTVFDKLLQLQEDTYSIKEINFDIENAFYENKLDKEEFNTVIAQTSQFLLAKMNELGYDVQSNSAKNYMLFQFFSETLALKSTKQKHLAFKYDFEDYTGKDNYSKLFVSKLLATGTGQCHSMPLLYLILAESLQAEAYLALSPNHSYIRFPDDAGKWFNIELTNGMFSTTSYILQSGYIKSEALQNNIYMENLSKKELLGQHYTDLASGYIHKFGYDEFVEKIIDKALEYYPNSVNARIVKANSAKARFEYVMQQLGINPLNHQELQNIRNFPKAVTLLNEVNQRYDAIDNLGYEPMPEEVYQQWLQSMTDEKQKQDNETLSKQLKGVLKQTSKKSKN